jgi:hypothetical protein
MGPGAVTVPDEAVDLLPDVTPLGIRPAEMLMPVRALPFLTHAAGRRHCGIWRSVVCRTHTRMAVRRRTR